MKLPEECKKGEFHHCFNCMWKAGAVKYYCPKNGGNASYEPINGFTSEKHQTKVFKEYVLSDGPLYKLKKEDFDTDGKLRIKSKSHEKEIFKKLGVHAMERGEVVMDIKMELKDRPKKRIYSFLNNSYK